MRSSIIIGLILFLGLPHKASAQYAAEDSIFFDTAAIQYQTWLEYTNFSEVLSVHNYECNAEKLTLVLTTYDRTTWLNLRNSYQDKHQKHIGKILFKEMRFLFEVPIDAAFIKIISTNDDYDITIKYENQSIIVDELFAEGIRMKGVSPISMNTTSTAPIIAKNRDESEIEDLKKRIIDHFQAHYIGKEQPWGREAHIDVLEIDNEFSIEITNISKEILDDFMIGYFELIVIDVLITPKGNDIEIDYDFRGKYGSGIFIAPRRSGYKDMTPKYSEYLKRYNLKIRKMILDVVNSTPIQD